MKLPVFIVLLASLPAFAFAMESPRCTAKATSLEQKIQDAKDAGRSDEAAKMAGTLSKLKSDCAEQRLQEERQGAVEEPEADVRKREMQKTK